MKKNRLNKLLVSSIFILLLWSCGVQKEVSEIVEQEKGDIEISKEEQKVFESGGEEPVVIADEKTEYEIIIIQPGFNAWLSSFARPVGYYDQAFLESRNRILVTNYNIRARQPSLFNPQLYQMEIDYSPFIDYGYEVNYKLYYFFIFFQRRFDQRLSGFLPRV